MSEMKIKHVVSKNEKRNMQQVIMEDGSTRHVPIDTSKPVKAKKRRETKEKREKKRKPKEEARTK